MIKKRNEKKKTRRRMDSPEIYVPDRDFRDGKKSSKETMGDDRSAKWKK